MATLTVPLRLRCGRWRRGGPAWGCGRRVSEPRTLLRLEPVAVSAEVEGPQLSECLSNQIALMGTFP